MGDSIEDMLNVTMKRLDYIMNETDINRALKSENKQSYAVSYYNFEKPFRRNSSRKDDEMLEKIAELGKSFIHSFIEDAVWKTAIKTISLFKILYAHNY